MLAERWRRMKEAFQSALAVPRSGRAALLEELCGEDDELRRDIEQLLAAHDRTADFLSVPVLANPGDLGDQPDPLNDAPDAAGSAREAAELPSETPSSATAAHPWMSPEETLTTGACIGAYRIVGELGKGGNGSGLRCRTGRRSVREAGGRQARQARARHRRDPRSIPSRASDLGFPALDLFELGLTFSRMEAHVEAEQTYRESLEILRRVLPENHPHVSQLLTGLGYVYMKKGQPQQAAKPLREALRIRLETLGGEAWRTAVTRSTLGECLMLQGRYLEAEPLLVEGYRGLRAQDGPTRAALERLVTYYDRVGSPELASEYRTARQRRPVARRFGTSFDRRGAFDGGRSGR